MLASKTHSLLTRSRTNLVAYARWSYYFHIDKAQRNIDFPLNVGYNEHY